MLLCFYPPIVCYDICLCGTHNTSYVFQVLHKDKTKFFLKSFWVEHVINYTAEIWQENIMISSGSF